MSQRRGGRFASVHRLSARSNVTDSPTFLPGFLGCWLGPPEEKVGLQEGDLLETKLAVHQKSRPSQGGLAEGVCVRIG